MRGFLAVNPRAGRERPGTDELVDAARRRGVETHVLEPDDDVAAIVAESGAEVVGAAGGDGSIGPVAGACLELGAAFVCVPFGTRNHFARDLGLDRDDPLAALAGFDADAVERRIDVGRADGRVFVNNVSLGLYADLVHDREARRRRREAFARLKALRRLAATPHPVPLRLDGAPLAARLVLVANNAYTPLRAFSLGERERLDEGRLHLYVASGVLPGSWEERAAERFVLEAPAGGVEAAIDGEPAQFGESIELVSEPRALRVRLPRAAAEAPE